METLFLILKSVLLGIVEGVTEFLPVSSTGHLVIAENLIGFRGQSPNYVEMYTYVIQLGAILAVVVLYWAKIKETLVHFFPRPGAYDRSGFKFWFTIFVACIPGGVLGVLFDDLAEQYLFAPVPVYGLIWRWAFDALCRKRFRSNQVQGRGVDVSLRQAWTIGLFQCLAIIPGCPVRLRRSSVVGRGPADGSRHRILLFLSDPGDGGDEHAKNH